MPPTDISALRARAAGRTRNRTALLAAGFGLGLLARLLLVTSPGTLDMETYLRWGHETLDLGLGNAYSGGYFPVAFQLFGSVVRFAERTGLSEITALKATTLACDGLTFGLLIMLLRRWGAPLGYAMLYWISPYFLAVSWLGYVDAEMALMLMAFLVLADRAHTRFGDLLAGVPLALLVMYKPQGMLAAGCVLILAVVATVRRRPEVAPLPRTAAFLGAPVLLFLAYSAWIGSSPSHSPLYLTETILDTQSASPSLSGNMPNVWLLVAGLYRSNGEPLYAVTEPDVFHPIALALTIVLIVAAIAWLVPRIAERSFSQRLVIALAAGMVIYPMTATATHENHLFLGAVALVPVCALLRDSRVTWLFSALLAVQFVNLFALYGFGYDDSHYAPRWLTDAYVVGWRLLVAAVSVALWLILLWALARPRPPAGARPGLSLAGVDPQPRTI